MANERTSPVDPIGFSEVVLGLNPPSGRVAPRWLRVAFWMAGPISLSWSVVGFTLLFAWVRWPPPAQHFLNYVEAFLGGMGVGILLLFVFSGEFFSEFFGGDAAHKKPGAR